MRTQNTDYGRILEVLGHDQRGATAVEYGLLIGLVAVGLAGGLGALADLVNLVFNMISADVTTVSADVQATGAGTSG